jgi:peptidyl-prolyl cis-trans isomerase B (cyclophilin B)
MRTSFLSISALSLALAGFCSCQETATEAPAKKPAAKEPAVEAKVTDIKIKLTTSKGVIEGTIFASKAPMTSANYLNLAKRGYYNGLKFHRVIPNFMIQGGDPDGRGSGGPGYKFQDECRSSLTHDKPGMLSMANAGPGTDGSQFFLTFVPTPHLDGRHTIFGSVVEGLDVVKELEKRGSSGGQTSEKLLITTATISLD